MNPDDMCDELIDLAEASLALGDADAALQLLDQVEDLCHDNRWIASQVEALRLSGDFEGCRKLATTSLTVLIDQQDWSNATRVLLECGRVYSDLYASHDCIVFLNEIAVKLRNLAESNEEFQANLLAILSSRILEEGDLETANQLITTLESSCADLQDWRVEANLCWLKSQIALKYGNLSQAMDLMDDVIRIYQTHDDALAGSRAISHMCWLATLYLNVGERDLMRAHDWLKIALNRELGESMTVSSWWLGVFDAHLQLLLGDAEHAKFSLEAIGDFSFLDESAHAWLQWLHALCEFELGDTDQAIVHLDASAELSLQFADDVSGRAFLHRLALLYIDLELVDTGKNLLAMTRMESVDYSWCRTDFG